MAPSAQEVAMDAQKTAERYLHEGETLLYAASPHQVKILDEYDILLLPLTLLIGAALLTAVIAPFAAGGMRGFGFFSLLGILLLLIAFYLTIGRLWYRTKRMKREVYAITDRRVLLIHTLREETVDELPRHEVHPVIKGRNIRLAPRQTAGDLFYALGLDLFFHAPLQATPVMRSLENPQQAERCLRS